LKPALSGRTSGATRSRFTFCALKSRLPRRALDRTLDGRDSILDALNLGSLRKQQDQRGDEADED
jgi:hypothetical protein